MSEHDPVRPAHYNDFEIKPIDAIRDWGLNFNLGNVVKYVARAGKKDPAKTIEDLRKAEHYLQHELTMHLFAVDDDQESVLDAITRISKSTGFSENKVLETALNLYEDAIEAKRDGLAVGIINSPDALDTVFFGLFEGDEDSEEDETDEPEPFAVGDPVKYAIGEDVPTGGVVKEVKPADGRLIYTVEWEAEDGDKWQDEHWHHELSPEPTAPTVDPSKTAVCYRCAKCGMPIAPGGEKLVTYLTEEIVAYHEACYEGAVPASDEAKPAKPKFAVGDKVRFADPRSNAVGVVMAAGPDAKGRMEYKVAWSAPVDAEVDRWHDINRDEDIRPFEVEPSKPKFKFGDKVRHETLDGSYLIIAPDGDRFYHVLDREDDSIASFHTDNLSLDES